MCPAGFVGGIPPPRPLFCGQRGWGRCDLHSLRGAFLALWFGKGTVALERRPSCAVVEEWRLPAFFLVKGFEHQGCQAQLPSFAAKGFHVALVVFWADVVLA